MKTVIQVFGSLNAGGAESRTMDVFRALDRSKYRFIFVSLDTSEGQFYENEIHLLGGEILKIESPRQVGIWSHVGQLIQLFRRLKSKYDADVVHAHTSYHIGIVMLAASLAGIPVRIAHARTTSSIHQGGISNKCMNAIGKRLVKIFSTHRLALNNETALSLFGSEKNVKIIPNAIPLEHYNIVGHSDVYFDIPDSELVICHIGRFQPMKNHGLLLEIFASFIGKHPNSRLVMVGDGPLKASIQSRVIDLGLDKHVKFAGLRRDVPEILNRASVFVFPSKYEGLGGVVLEAQASGVSCVVSDTVPRNVDMGLNLVEFVSLDAPIDVWQAAIERALAKPRPDFATRYGAFDKRGFTLEHEIKLLTAIYENSDYNHHDL